MDQLGAKLATIIQQMVPADVAGVMFTANPVTGEQDELVIDANPGLGEVVVGDLVTPDHFVLNKRFRQVIEQKTGKREVVIRTNDGGGTEPILPIGLGMIDMVSPPFTVASWRD